LKNHSSNGRVMLYLGERWGREWIGVHNGTERKGKGSNAKLVTFPVFGKNET